MMSIIENNIKIIILNDYLIFTQSYVNDLVSDR